MNRLLLVVGLLGSSACGSEVDDRPPTLAYVTEAILQPACGQAECHSTFKAQVGDVFDTVHGARRSLVQNGLLVYDQTPTDARLITVLTTGLPSILYPNTGNVRMPYDQPMPDYDLNLIKEWISTGPPGGNGPVDAECAPGDNNDTQGCTLLGTLVKCDNGHAGDLITDCTATGGSCVEGQCVN